MKVVGTMAWSLANIEMYRPRRQQPNPKVGLAREASTLPLAPMLTSARRALRRDQWTTRARVQEAAVAAVAVLLERRGIEVASCPIVLVEQIRQSQLMSESRCHSAVAEAAAAEPVTAIEAAVPSAVIASAVTTGSDAAAATAVAADPRAAAVAAEVVAAVAAAVAAALTAASVAAAAAAAVVAVPNYAARAAESR